MQRLVLGAVQRPGVQLLGVAATGAPVFRLASVSAPYGFRRSAFGFGMIEPGISAKSVIFAAEWAAAVPRWPSLWGELFPRLSRSAWVCWAHVGGAWRLVDPCGWDPQAYGYEAVRL